MEKPYNEMFIPEIISGDICPYCLEPTHYVDSSEVYSKSYGMIYLCPPCKAWVGTHSNGLALGRLANAELREAKKEAHHYFDQLWKSGYINKLSKKFIEGGIRKKAYLWLSYQLGVQKLHCHIGYFDVDMCKRVVEIVKKHYPECIPYEPKN